MKLTKRQIKGSKLTIEEMDENLDYLNAQASVWENVTETVTERKAGLIIEPGELPTDGDTITIGNIIAEFDTVGDGVSDPSHYRIDLTQEKAFEDWISNNNANNTADIISVGDWIVIEAKVAGIVGNNIVFDTSLSECKFKDPYTQEHISRPYALVGGRDEGISLTDKIKPKSSKKIPASIIDDLKLDDLKSLNGTNYLYVAGIGTPAENGIELQETYDAAKLLRPNDNDPSGTNRIKILIGPGKYEMDSLFRIDTEFIDICSLSGDADVFIYTKSSQINPIGNGSNIDVYSDNVIIKGIDASTVIWDKSTGLQKPGMFNIIDRSAHTNNIYDNCVGGDNSFGYDYGIADGTFINCRGGDNSFGVKEAPGKFINCIGGNNSFGHLTASGEFIDCVGGDNSFGGYDTASGEFIDCVGGSQSFGFQSSTGTFTNCVGGDNSFSHKIAAGVYRNCRGGQNSFGSELTGKVYYCEIENGQFKMPRDHGEIFFSKDTNGAITYKNHQM